MSKALFYSKQRRRLHLKFNNVSKEKTKMPYGQPVQNKWKFLAKKSKRNLVILKIFQRKIEFIWK